MTFRYKDYRRNGQARYRTMTLAADEFIRRFLLHVLPKGFHRIRHYGLLASAGCKANIARARELIAAPVPAVDPPAAHDAEPDSPPDIARHVLAAAAHDLVEVFGRGGAPRGPPSGDAGTGPEPMIFLSPGGSIYSRNISFPAAGPCRPGPCERWNDITDLFSSGSGQRQHPIRNLQRMPISAIRR